MLLFHQLHQLHQPLTASNTQRVDDPIEEVVVDTQHMHPQPPGGRKPAHLDVPIRSHVVDAQRAAPALPNTISASASTPSKKFQPLPENVLLSATSSANKANGGTLSHADVVKRQVFASIPVTKREPAPQEFKVELVTMVNKGWKEQFVETIKQYGMDYSWLNSRFDDHGWHLHHWAAWNKSTPEMCILLDGFGQYCTVLCRSLTGESQQWTLYYANDHAYYNAAH